MGVLLCLLPGTSQACGSAPQFPTYPVAWVYDGDTLRLDDDRKIRLIGVDTPELGRDGEPGEPYARRALQRLRQLIEHGGQGVRLRLGTMQKDRYGRYLAHVYLPDGRDTAELLLREGLAHATVFPPNILHLECLLEAEAQAREARRGLWRQARVPDARELPETTAGFHLVRGRIERVGSSERALWLNLEGGLGLRIDRKDLTYFPGLLGQPLAGRELEVRGWIYRHGGAPRMQVRHGAAIRWLSSG